MIVQRVVLSRLKTTLCVVGGSGDCPATGLHYRLRLAGDERQDRGGGYYASDSGSF